MREAIDVTTPQVREESMEGVRLIPHERTVEENENASPERARSKQTSTESRTRMRPRSTVTWSVVFIREPVFARPSATMVSTIAADSLTDGLPLAVLDCW